MTTRPTFLVVLSIHDAPEAPAISCVTAFQLSYAGLGWAGHAYPPSSPQRTMQPETPRPPRCGRPTQDLRTWTWTWTWTWTSPTSISRLSPRRVDAYGDGYPRM
ncbi:hypothetical protein B0H19DRAFT_1273811 [Mycena capillaripes]|nr:hypothetical protein B0H19DRAFT_1273811 [Mycena capillaripes]